MVGSITGWVVSSTHYESRLFEHQMVDTGQSFHWPGPSEAFESQLDLDRNGIYEEWLLMTWAQRDLSLDAIMSDEDQNGASENCTVNMTIKSHEVRIFHTAVFDTDISGTYDALDFGLKVDDKKTFEYKDVNLDGEFDIFIDYRKRLSWIIVGTRMIEVIKHGEPKGKRVTAKTEDGKIMEFHFLDDQWQVIEDSQ